MAINPMIALQAGDAVADVGQAVGTALTSAQQYDQLKRNRLRDELLQKELDKKEQISGILGQIGEQEQMPAGMEGPAPILSQSQLIAQAKQIDPVMANEQLNALGLDDASKRAQASRFAAEIKSLPLEQQNERIRERANELRSQGRDPKDTEQLLGMNPQQRAAALQGIQMLDLSSKERLTLEQKDRAAAAGLRSPAKVQSSDILPDGSTIQIMNDGKTRVTDPAGNVLTGKARSAAIRKAQEFGVNIQQRRSQGRELGKFSAEKAEKVSERAEKMRENNDTLRGIIEEVKAGGDSGPLINKLPTLKSASLRLNQLKNQLGLDVIGSVTFGALSEGEMKLAMRTAVPDLRGPELVKWAEKKIEAQEKMAGYLEQQATFLSEPGNTVADWMEFVKSKKAERDKAAQKKKDEKAKTGVIKFDRQGTRIQ